MSAESDSTAARLCAACGMCCDGVLFHSVALQPGDSARALSALGLKIKRRGGAHFLQPCSAHQNSCCTIYDQRPTRCRLFNCRQLLRVGTGEISEAMALDKIREAREQIHRVNALMHRTGETNPNRGLAQRCANALTAPVRTPLHNELETAMSELEELLQNNFRVP
jgi:hypothetical protein